MNLKSLKINKDNFSLKKIKEASWGFLLNRFGAIFLSIFLIAASFGGLVIYKYMYNSDWSDTQKMEYRTQVEKSKPPFDIEKFDTIVERIKERNNSTHSDVVISKDIFGTTE